MDNTTILAHVLGIVFVVLGISMVFNKKSMSAVVADLVSNNMFMWFGGLIALIIGAIMIAINNSWTSGLTLFVTVIGWVALLKGIFILVFPSMAASFYKKIIRGGVIVWAGLIMCVIGIVLFT